MKWLTVSRADEYGTAVLRDEVVKQEEGPSLGESVVRRLIAKASHIASAYWHNILISQAGTKVTAGGQCYPACCNRSAEIHPLNLYHFIPNIDMGHMFYPV